MFVAGQNQLPLLYMGADFSVFAKPGGITTFGFVNTIETSFQNTAEEISKNATPKPFAVHHLDMDTSGCLIVSANSDARGRLCMAFRDREVKKEYLAIVTGVPNEDLGIIRAPLLVEGSRYTHPTTKIHRDGKNSETHYRLLASDGFHSLLSLKPVTGLTHQLRVHCSSMLNTPIMGDPWYNPHENQSEPPMYLHAHQISIPDACSAGGMLKVLAPLPSYMAAKIAAMGPASLFDDGPVN